MAEKGKETRVWGLVINSEWLGYILFVSLLALIYIYLAHRTDNMVRDIDKAKKELVELRAEHITLKSEIVQKSSRTSVSERLETRGVGEPDKAVIRIKKKDGER